MESNYQEYRPQYRPISTESGVTTTDTEVVAAETERERESAYVSRKRVCGGLLQNHRYTPQYSTKTEADPS